jgi:hypothetical protein
MCDDVSVWGTTSFGETTDKMMMVPREKKSAPEDLMMVKYV